MAKNIVLIGFMGTGKSTVGIKLAERLRMKFVDMDREIEKISGMTIPMMFKKHGEVRFRSEEALMAKKLSQCSSLVIATGGGVVLREDNVLALRRNGIMICLDADPQVILDRVNRKKGTRPLLKKNVDETQIEQMLSEREEYYRMADYRIDTSDKEMDKIVDEILQFIKQENKSRNKGC